MIKKLLPLLLLAPLSFAAEPLVYEGEGDGPGAGRHIVFIANDHEYRSEETCPALARILAKHHGFRCTVLFGIDEDGFIQAGDAPIPGLETLKDADLLVFFTRFMNLPDEQADQLVDYFERGGPVVGLRTSTHCFNKQEGKWAKLNFDYEGEDYRGGLGEQIFGNTWHKERGQSHYGDNHIMGSRISAVEASKDHPILSGVKPIHAFTGAYKSQPPAGSTLLVDVRVLNTFEPSLDFHPDKEVVSAAWTRDHYVAPSGEKKEARVVYASFGGSEDLLDENCRRFLVNACFWAGGREAQITEDLEVDLVGGFHPGPNMTGVFYRAGVKPADLAGWDSQVMPVGALMGGLDEKPNAWMGARIDRVLQPRPELVKWLEENQDGFDRSLYQPTAAKPGK
ncbi:ThuA domain-containing protein [Verrucomicrobiales bacterium BCK34]|nr:ThuA domain-containing protein [Verrucomicrobiales bacterium BCK34]